MTSDLSKTCSRTTRFSSYRVHLRDEENWWLFSRTFLFLWNWVRVNLSLRVFVRRETDERFFPNADRVTIIKCSVNKKKKNHDRYKKENPMDEDVDTTRHIPVQLVWRELFRQRNPGRRRTRHVVYRCRNRIEVFDHFRRLLSVSFVASYTLPSDRCRWRRRYFVRPSSLDGYTFYIA